MKYNLAVFHLIWLHLMSDKSSLLNVFLRITQVYDWVLFSNFSANYISFGFTYCLFLMELANYHIYNLITCLLLNRFFFEVWLKIKLLWAHQSKWRVLSVEQLLCLQGTLSSWDQLGYLENTVLRPEKRIYALQKNLIICILSLSKRLII